MTPRKRYSFWINEVQADRLKAVKAAKDISESEQIRQAINEWLDKQEGVIKTGRKRAGTRKRP